MKRSHVQVAAFIFFGAAGMGALFWLGANGYLASSGDAEERPLNYLALKLEGQFRRDIHKNPYSIDYSPKAPNTIVIAVAYYQRTDRALLNSIVRAAAENAQGVARDQFAIPRLLIETTWKELPGVPEPPSKEAPEH